MAGSEVGSNSAYTPLKSGNVNPATNPIDPDHATTTTVPRRRTLWDRLGPARLSVLLVGTAVLFVGLLILGLLWKESIRAASGAEARRPWISILGSNWATSVVTICAAFIRTSMSVQASLLTAMLGGIILEVIGVPIFQVPFYSIIRAVDAAPYDLLSPSMFRSKGFFSFFVYALIVLEVLVLIASQFTSTILVSDFEDGSFAQMFRSVPVHTWEVPNLRVIQKWWTVSPGSSWTFAEYSEPAVPDLDDTGHTYRAFLPFDDESRRASLRDYHGPAVVMDQRVVCARPALTNVSLVPMGLKRVGISGLAELDPGSFPVYKQPDATPRVNFSCVLPYLLPETDMAENPESILCFKQTQWDTIYLEDPLVDENGVAGKTNFSAVDEGWRLQNVTDYTTFVVVDILSAAALLREDDDFYFGNVTAIPRDGPWATVTNGSATDTEALRVTTCVTNLNALTFAVDIHSSRTRTEPAIRWDSDDASFNTDAILTQLGASRDTRSAAERGIMELGPRSEWEEGDFVNKSLPGAEFFALNTEGALANIQASAVTLSRREGLDESHGHLTHGAIFHDALRNTGSPARAVQATLARIHQMGYYDQLVQQNTRADAEASFATSALIPVRYRGFIAVTALIALHCAILAVVAMLFLGFTRHTLIGHTWQAVSNALSDETLPLLNHAGGMKDGEVEEWAKSQSVDLRRRHVVRHEGDGRVALRTQGSYSHITEAGEGRA